MATRLAEFSHQILAWWVRLMHVKIVSTTILDCRKKRWWVKLLTRDALLHDRCNWPEWIAWCRNCKPRWSEWSSASSKTCRAPLISGESAPRLHPPPLRCEESHKDCWEWLQIRSMLPLVWVGTCLHRQPNGRVRLPDARLPRWGKSVQMQEQPPRAGVIHQIKI